MKSADEVKRILFLCTGNSARSIMAEAYMNAVGAPNWRAFSAGSKPAGAPNPIVIAALKRWGYSTEGARSKSWDEFSGAAAPAMDVIVTVCDNAASEPCPVWPQRSGREPLRLHWSFDDPAAVTGDDDARRAAVERIFEEIRSAIDGFLSKPSR